jgi:hypothetical protein
MGNVLGHRLLRMSGFKAVVLYNRALTFEKFWLCFCLSNATNPGGERERLSCSVTGWRPGLVWSSLV